MAQVIVRNEEFWQKRRRIAENRKHLWRALLWPVRTGMELFSIWRRDEEDDGLILQVFQIILLIAFVGVLCTSIFIAGPLKIACMAVALIIYAFGGLLDFARRAWLP